MLNIELEHPCSAEELYARWDSNAPLDWRWKLAGQIADGTRVNPGEMSTELTSAVEFRRRHGGAQPLQSQCERRISAALALYETDDTVRWELEARLLAGETDAEIGRKTGLPAETVGAYEPLFCAVRYCSESHGYLLRQAVGYAHLRGFQDSELRQFWAWAALAGGTVVIDRLVDLLRRSIGPDEPATMSVYLGDDATTDLMFQGWIAERMIPRGNGDSWFAELRSRLQAVESSAYPEKARDALYRETIQVARHVLQTGCMPQQSRKTKAAGKSRSKAEANDRRQIDCRKQFREEQSDVHTRKQRSRDASEHVAASVTKGTDSSGEGCTGQS